MRIQNRTTYWQAVRWIAGNDEPAQLNWYDIKDMLTVVMVADLFQTNAEDVAKDVVTVRLNMDGGKK